MARTILIVDDELLIREVIKEYGSSNGYTVLEASDGLEAIKLVQDNQEIACIILDIMMPNLDGYSTLKRIKEIADIPVIMLSARTEVDDKLYGFDLGVDDYVSKPFSPKELMARIKVVIDRHNKTFKDSYELEGIKVNVDSHVLLVDNQEVHVTNKEFDLLVYLLNNPNHVFSRDELITSIWGYDNESDERTIDTHIKMLRKNLGQYGKNIKTVRGVGYKFEK